MIIDFTPLHETELKDITNLEIQVYDDADDYNNFESFEINTFEDLVSAIEDIANNKKIQSINVERKPGYHCKECENDFNNKVQVYNSSTE